MLRTCSEETSIFVSHTVNLPRMCPVSGNPAPGSSITVSYRARGVVFPVEDLTDFVDEYVGGRGSVRNMEEMVQDLATRVSGVVGVPVRAVADLKIDPPFGGEQQNMKVAVRAK